MAKKSNSVIKDDYEDKWKIQDGLRTLRDYEALKKDPKLLKAIQAEAVKVAKEATELAKSTGLSFEKSSEIEFGKPKK